MEEKTWRQLQMFADQIGISATSLVNASVKQMLRDNSITFTADSEYTP